MKTQLLLIKRLYLEGCEFSDHDDPFSSGLAISLFQDAVELFIWSLIKDRNINIKDNASFISNIDSLKKANINLSFKTKLLELNKARVGFKHYGNLPAPSESAKFRLYVEGFLTQSFSEYFGESFEDLSFVDLVPFDDVRKHMKIAEQLAKNNKYQEAMTDFAIAKTILFSKLNAIFPEVPKDLRNIDSVLKKIPELRNLKSFGYLTKYLQSLREASLASIMRLSLDDYLFVRNVFPNAIQSISGKWHTNHKANYNEDHCKRAIDCLVKISIRINNII